MTKKIIKDKNLTKIPDFKSYEEEANFWDTHSPLDFPGEFEPATITYVPAIKNEHKETMTIRIAPSLKKKIEEVAESYDISTSTLIRMWAIDRLRDALKKD